MDSHQQAGKVLEGVDPDAFGSLIRDATGSHVVEVVVQVGAQTCVEMRCEIEYL